MLSGGVCGSWVCVTVVTRRFGWQQVVLWCSCVMPWWVVLDMVGVSVAGSFPAVSFLGRFYGIVFCLLR